MKKIRVLADWESLMDCVNACGEHIVQKIHVVQVSRLAFDLTISEQNQCHLRLLGVYDTLLENLDYLTQWWEDKLHSM